MEKIENREAILKLNEFRIVITSKELIARFIETGIIDGAVSTVKEFVSKLKKKIPKGST